MACALIVAAVFFVCHLYLDKISHESLRNWMQTEKVDIQQGQLLSTITKNQRVLTSSDFIKGVALIDLTLERQNTLITFGETIDPAKIKEIASDQIKTLDVGFFSQIVVSKIPDQSDLAIAFFIDGQFLRIIFLTASLGLIFVFIVASTIIFILVQMESKQRERLMVAESKGKILFAEMAARVAHDIRSPMGVLSRITDTQFRTKEARIIIANATMRLQSITDDLIKYWQKEMKGQQTQTYDDVAKNKKIVLLNEIVDNLISEKRKLYQHLANVNFTLSQDSPVESLFVDEAELSRHLSNLADNAVEAVGLSGEITFRIISKKNIVEVEVKDTGCGIPEEILPQIGRKKLSVGKSHGSGQGVYYTRKFLRATGGELKIKSILGQGSTFTLVFPKNDRTLIIPKQIPMVYVDDDPLTHEPWENFFKSALDSHIDMKIFKTSAAYLAWAEDAPAHTLFSDYHLKDGGEHGLQIIEMAPASAETAYLITNSYDDPAVIASAAAQGVPVIPKNQLGAFEVEWC